MALAFETALPQATLGLVHPPPGRAITTAGVFAHGTRYMRTLNILVRTPRRSG